MMLMGAAVTPMEVTAAAGFGAATATVAASRVFFGVVWQLRRVPMQASKHRRRNRERVSN
jgi:hypothetical protein